MGKKYSVAVTEVSEDLSLVLSELTGLTKIDKDAIKAIADATGPDKATIWLNGCSFCWDPVKEEWKRCCIAHHDSRVCSH